MIIIEYLEQIHTSKKRQIIKSTNQNIHTKKTQFKKSNININHRSTSAIYNVSYFSRKSESSCMSEMTRCSGRTIVSFEAHYLKYVQEIITILVVYVQFIYCLW